MLNEKVATVYGALPRLAPIRRARRGGTRP
jgi:hypothetical protein